VLHDAQDAEGRRLRPQDALPKPAPFLKILDDFDAGQYMELIKELSKRLCWHLMSLNESVSTKNFDFIKENC